MRIQTRLLLTTGSVMLRTAQAQAMSPPPPPPTYVYDVGPNTVDQAGTSCRANNELTEQSNVVRHESSGTTVASGSGTTRLYCPLNARAHTFYGVSGQDGDQEPLTVNLTDVTVEAWDGNRAADLTCFAFSSDLGTGSWSIGDTTYLCSNQLGCPSDEVDGPSYVGSNNMLLSYRAPTTFNSVNWGYVCDLQHDMQISWAEAAVTPNP